MVLLTLRNSWADLLKNKGIHFLRLFYFQYVYGLVVGTHSKKPDIGVPYNVL